MKKSIFKAIPILAISGSMLFAQYYDPYYYQDNNYNNQNNGYQDNNYNTQNNAYQNNNTAAPANNYYNYYEEFMKVLSREANDPNSIFYSPSFSQQYNNNTQMSSNPYQDVMDAMNLASQNYNAQNNTQSYDNSYNQDYNNTYDYSQNYNNQTYNNIPNPYEELMNMLEKESKNPNSPYYSPNTDAQNNNSGNNGYNGYDNGYNAYQYYYDPYQNNYAAQDYSYDNNNQTSAYESTEKNPYELAAEELIKAAEELTKKANEQQNNNNNVPANNNAQYNAAPADNSTKKNTQNFYTPFKVPQKVFDAVNRAYPNAQIWDISVENIGIYQVQLNNGITLHVDRNGRIMNEGSGNY